MRQSHISNKLVIKEFSATASRKKDLAFLISPLSNHQEHKYPESFIAIVFSLMHNKNFLPSASYITDSIKFTKTLGQDKLDLDVSS